MTPQLALHRKLNEAGRRIRALLVFQWMARTLCWTALACLAWLLASRFTRLPQPSDAALVGALLAAAVVGAAIGLARRITRMDVARLTDRRAEMKERFSSAVEFQAATSDDPLVQRQIVDAGAHAEALDLSGTYPLRISREAIGFI